MFSPTVGAAVPVTRATTGEVYHGIVEAPKESPEFVEKALGYTPKIETIIAFGRESLPAVEIVKSWTLGEEVFLFDGQQLKAMYVAIDGETYSIWFCELEHENPASLVNAE